MDACQNHQAVHQLWPTQDSGPATSIECDIVFVHGLHVRLDEHDGGDAWLRTWTLSGSDGKICWPRDWLPEDMNCNIRVLSVSYPTDIEKWFGENHYEHFEVERLGEHFREVLVKQRRWNLGCRPFVLVGYDFGGLVIKALVNEMQRLTSTRVVHSRLDESLKSAAESFVRNICGIAFYAVPHTGSHYGRYIQTLQRSNINTVVRELRQWQQCMETLSNKLRDAIDGRRVNIYAFIEGQQLPEIQDFLVPAASAMHLAGDHYCHIQDRNHFNICNPTSREHESYTMLLQFLTTCRDEWYRRREGLEKSRRLLKKARAKRVRMKWTHYILTCLSGMNSGALNAANHLESVENRVADRIFSAGFDSSWPTLTGTDSGRDSSSASWW